MTTMNRLAAQILGWANDRNLIEGSTVQKQYVKLVEEHGEFAAGLARGKQDVMADALGDKMVILIIMAAQGGVSLLHPLCAMAGCTDPDYDACVAKIIANLSDKYKLWGVEMCFRHSCGNIGVLANYLDDVEGLQEGVGCCFGDVIAQCVEAGFSPVQVLEDVWNIIKDRKGKMVDGVFIKENDAMMSGGTNTQ